MDDYSYVAEFMELATRQHEQGNAALSSALAAVDASQGPVLDLGAGSGRATELVATALPQARILAVEPSVAMRAALTSRVIRSDDLRKRVTILADTAQEVELPGRLSAALVLGVAGHLKPTERRALWAKLVERLAPGAPLFVELMPLATPARVPKTQIIRDTVGEQLYEMWLSGEPTGPDLMQWTTAWQISKAGKVMRTVNAQHEWFTFGIADLSAETGLVAKKLTPQLAVLSH